ncbi:MAG: hypothetical protein WD928_16760 [Gammaproteobacteria bacterium]
MASLGLLDPYLESDALAACFAGPALVERMLAFEAALARAEGELGIIPAAAAAVIVASTREDPFDLAAIARDTRETSSPAIALVAQLTAAVAARDATAAAYVRWGSTSQDVMDSAIMLCCRAACSEVRSRGRRLDEVLAEDPDVVAHLGPAALARAMDPLAQRGVNEPVIEQALARLAASNSSAPPARTSVASDEGDKHA